MMNYLLMILGILSPLLLSPDSPEKDWRSRENGFPIYKNGYIDQPYVVVLNNRNWLCVFTTGAGSEGTGGQHIVCSISKDQGKNWSKPLNIEDPSQESASWGMPYLTKYGRVYVFYDYNGDKIHSLRNQTNIREDMLGWYCFKYSDDNGNTWSERYRLSVRTTKIDLTNDWLGKVQILWGIGKPVNVDKGMMFGFSKIGKYLIDESEGWFFRCDNINIEKDPEKLKWKMLPEGENPLKNPDFGLIQEEQNIFQMNNGDLYCMYRTIMGNPACSYSRDGGHTWDVPQVPSFYTGMKIKNPRACPRIWKCKNGKYLFWFHNHGGWNFENRNPAWISGGIEKDGKIIWSQPEILLYEQDIAKRMSYPDLIEQDGKYWITETNKETALCHQVDADFLNNLWNQFSIDSISKKSLILDMVPADLVNNEIELPELNSIDAVHGITIDFTINLPDLSGGQVIIDSRDSGGKGLVIETADYGAIKLSLSDGNKTSKWTSDQGLIKAFNEHEVTIMVDQGPGIIMFVIDGIFNDGRDYRQFGWGRFDNTMNYIGEGKLRLTTLIEGKMRSKSKITSLKIYNRCLTITEAVGNYRAWKNKMSNIAVNKQSDN